MGAYGKDLYPQVGRVNNQGQSVEGCPYFTL